MAFMRMMGRDSVAYHQATVLGRADDHPGQSLDYYGSRGETPLVWGGAGAGRLGLDGRVTEYTYAAVFGESGATDPVTGDRLVNTTRPGMELVVSPHKSVAVLGAIGRADDMHAIVDAETRATLEFLDGWFQERGGRRGRDQVRTATSGLTWAVTRHGTSRAGDPAVHDHVLIANIVEMRDLKGGWKGLDTASLRDVLHAATVVGRTAAARRAVELGYAIVPDEGRSGRLRSWRIAGISDEVCELFSKRSAEIDDFVDNRSSYRARAVAARTTRAAKDDLSPDLLAVRWQTELAEIGWGPERLCRSIDALGGERQVPELVPNKVPTPVPAWRVSELAEAVLGPESRLGGTKVLSRRDLLVEMGPHFYGLPVELLESTVDQILESSVVVPLVALTAAREQVYAPTRTLAVEHAVAETVERFTTGSEARPVDPHAVHAALSAKEAALAAPLSAGQLAAVEALTAGGDSRVHFIVGVAGSGKTTTLDAATTAFERDGYRVLGASTSGQAARTLGEQAQIDTRTVASLLWRLDHGQVVLDRNTIVVLDEAAMTTDDDLLRLVSAVDVTGARLVLVGDPVQLGAVGPGGAMAALMDRHPHLVTRLDENLRQHDPAERAAIARLRNGNIEAALHWYRVNDRVQTATSRPEAIEATVAAWNRDVEAGRSTTMLAWRRDDVHELNHAARDAAIAAGRVHGPKVDVDGLEIAAGDQLVALAPNHRARIVTSQRLTVAHLDTDRATATLTSGDQRVELPLSEIDPERFAYGYATTIHRAQGATFDTAHVYADGGNHQLAYVAVTRARQFTTIHAPAETVDQAIEDLRAAWTRPATQRWIIDDRPDPRHHDRHPRQASEDLRRARLWEERQALRALPDTLFDTTGQSGLLEQRRHFAREQQNLRTGTGQWANTPAGRAVRRHHAATAAHTAASIRADDSRLPRKERRLARREAAQLVDAIHFAADAWAHHGQPIDHQLTAKIEALDTRLASMPSPGEQQDRAIVLQQRLEHLDIDLGLAPPEPARRITPPSLSRDVGLGIGL